MITCDHAPFLKLNLTSGMLAPVRQGRPPQIRSPSCIFSSILVDGGKVLCPLKSFAGAMDPCPLPPLSNVPAGKMSISDKNNNNRIMVKRKIFCMLRNTLSKLMSILYHLIMAIFNFFNF
jgi:hypothetical protein